MNSSQRRRLIRITDRAVTGHALSCAELRFLKRMSLSARQKLALSEDLTLPLDSGGDMSTLTKLTEKEST
jgi:hypothetical protein